MKIRIKFEKTGPMKFVGHLDTMRFFQRAIKRADIDIKFTMGYSPHPIMSFALPLGVGVESRGEYFDIQVNSTISSDSAIRALNRQMPEGVKILSYKKLTDDAKKSMSIVEAADYILELRDGYTVFDNFDKVIREFYSQNEINIIKQTKKSERSLDLKPLIFDMEYKDSKLFMRLKAGSVNNIKPQLVLETLYRYANEQYNEFTFKITRVDLYTFGEDGEFISLGDFGEEADE